MGEIVALVRDKYGHMVREGDWVARIGSMVPHRVVKVTPRGTEGEWDVLVIRVLGGRQGAAVVEEEVYSCHVRRVSLGRRTPGAVARWRALLASVQDEKSEG